ncbi:MAG TPA: hypothetical protein VNJ47_09730 [Nevskiales bacterium]|nr:hypothetical protein [Nevskiales bacterium]
MAFAVAHCTAGDLLIGMTAVVLALLAQRAGTFREWLRRAVPLTAILLAMLYMAPASGSA